MNHQGTEIDTNGRYGRHLALPGFGNEGQRRLVGARVLVVGAGGLGSPVIQYLAAAGIGTLGVVDADRVERSNLQRQTIHTENGVGERKTNSAERFVNGLNSLVDVEAHPYRLTSANALELFADYDVVVDCTDNFPTRFLVSDAAEILGLPVVWGSIYQYEGQTAVFWRSPSDEVHGVTYRDLFSASPPPDMVTSCEEGGVLGAMCGVIGSAMAMETIKVISGIGDPAIGFVNRYDAWTSRWSRFRVHRDPGRPAIEGLVDYEAFCGVQPVPTVDANSLADSVSRGERFELIDVREEEEYALDHIPGARLVPKSRLSTDGLRSWMPDQQTKYVVMCKSGGRSAAVVRDMIADGYSSVASLEGGILAYRISVG